MSLKKEKGIRQEKQIKEVATSFKKMSSIY
jgi:hypothetical protein